MPKGLKQAPKEEAGKLKVKDFVITDEFDTVKAGASVKLGCDHTNYPAHTLIPAETLASLAGDLK